MLDRLDARAMELVTAVGLADFAEAQAVDLPYGRKRALEIATTLALEPEMMLLDEPMAGLGQEDIKRIAALIRTVAKDRTVLMVEHNMSVVADLSDTITVLARGEVLAEGPTPRSPSIPPSSRLMSGPVMAETLLKVAGLQAWYGESHILHGVDFEIRRGELVTLLGRNGAGKTTTLRSIMGIVEQAHRLDRLRRQARPSACRRIDIAAPGHRLLPRGARHLLEPERRGEPAACRRS